MCSHTRCCGSSIRFQRSWKVCKGTLPGRLPTSARQSGRVGLRHQAMAALLLKTWHYLLCRLLPHRCANLTLPRLRACCCSGRELALHWTAVNMKHDSMARWPPWVQDTSHHMSSNMRTMPSNQDPPQHRPSSGQLGWAPDSAGSREVETYPSPPPQSSGHTYQPHHSQVEAATNTSVRLLSLPVPSSLGRTQVGCHFSSRRKQHDRCQQVTN